MMSEDFEGITLDACLIAAAQRAEHYEMAAYGTLVAWAKAMGHQEAAGLLEEILEEEKAADEKLTQIAEAGINQEAAQVAQGGDEEGMEMAMAGAGARSSASGRSSGRSTVRNGSGSSRGNSSRGSSSRSSSSSRSRGSKKR